ncbi:MAG: hypothetical protein A2Z08_11765 [Deltaproteobacteria bacterium RBG_16_54_11]|jgi:hypothetical protein|nr:MAG: hypothetical protein A2Z08_11765 [Deltaproteobacteria bacterium RBG_16_54_11]
MDRIIKICFGDFVVRGELNESPTAALIWEALPIEGEGNLWGEEIYFAIPVEAELDDSARAVVERGDLGYWPQGRALCIFFGPTPASQGDEIRPASPVNLVGKIRGDLQIFKGVTEGTMVRLDKER